MLATIRFGFFEDNGAGIATGEDFHTIDIFKSARIARCIWLTNQLRIYYLGRIKDAVTIRVDTRVNLNRAALNIRQQPRYD